MQREAIGGIVLVIGLIVPSALADDSRTVKVLWGVEPGITTRSELLASEKFGQPQSVIPAPEGNSPDWLLYEIAPWKQVRVAVREDVVRVIWLYPPPKYDDLDYLANAMDLGPLKRPTFPTKIAHAVLDLPEGQNRVESERVFASFVYEEGEGGKHVQYIVLHGVPESVQPSAKGNGQMPAGKSDPAASSQPNSLEELLKDPMFKELFGDEDHSEMYQEYLQGSQEPESPSPPRRPPEFGSLTGDPKAFDPDPPPPPPTPTAPGPPPPPENADRGPGESAAAPAQRLDTSFRVTIQTVVKLAEESHVSGHPLDEEITQRTIRLLLDRYDPLKFHFLQADVDRARRASASLVSQLRRGDFQLAKDVQDTFVTRQRERIDLAETLLTGDLDFSKDEEIAVLPEATQYCQTEAQVRDLWRRRMKYLLLREESLGKSPDEARQIVGRRLRGYREQVDKLDDADAVDALLDSVLRSFDPHSQFYSPRESATSSTLVNQEFVGIGASLRDDGGHIVIAGLIPNSPADRLGKLQIGDRILAVGEGPEGRMVDVVGERLSEVVERIRGPLETIVRLRVLPEGRFDSSVHAITRGRVSLNSLAGTVLGGENLPGGGDGRVGYVEISKFYVDAAAKVAGDPDYRSTSRELASQLERCRAEGVDAIVLDLRRNSGGSLSEVIECCGLLVGSGPVMRVKNRDGAVQDYRPQNTSRAWDGPLVVLTSQMTGSGAEILAGAIVDYHGGLVVGDVRTAGAGTVAGVIDVGKRLYQIPEPPEMGVVLLTQQRFYRPCGKGIQQRGIASHLPLPSLASAIFAGEEENLYALGYDEIPPAELPSAGDPIDAGLLERLIAQSRERTARNAYFESLASEILDRGQRRKQTQFSVNRKTYLDDIQIDSASRDWATVPGVPQVKMDPYLQEVLRVTLDYVTGLQAMDGKAIYEERDYTEGIDMLRRATAIDPEYAQAHYLLAWSLATCPRDDVRDGDAAVRHAMRACELTDPTPWHYSLCLAIAQAEAGDFDAATADLGKALSAAPDDQRTAFEYLEKRFQAGQPFQTRGD